MMDQLVEETIVTLHPDVLRSMQATEALRRLMAYYSAKHPASYWARLVGTTTWRYQRHELIRSVAEQEWAAETEGTSALHFAELMVLAAEACAGRWEPEQCRIMAVRIDGVQTMSLVCSLEGK